MIASGRRVLLVLAWALALCLHVLDQRVLSRVVDHVSLTSACAVCTNSGWR